MANSVRILLTLAALATPALAQNKVVPVAGPYIDHLSPPAVTRGRTNRIMFLGHELDSAIDVWTSTPNIKIKATRVGDNNEKQATFDLEVPANAPVGLHGLRIATQSGLSNTHLFLIDELPIQSRQALASPMKIALPAAVHGTRPPSTIDRYEIDVQSGQSVTFEVIGNRFGKNHDPMVTIRDPDGQFVTQHDNDAGLFFDLRFAHTFAKAGRYFVDVRDARYAGDPTWHYVLRMGNFPVARVAVPSTLKIGATSRVALPQIAGAKVDLSVPEDSPRGKHLHEVRLGNGVATWIPMYASDAESHIESEPNDEAKSATSVTIPSALHGVLQQRGDVDCFTFEMKQGKNFTFHAESQGIGSPADLELVLLNQDGREVRRIDDVVVYGPGENWWMDAKFDFYAQKDGPHTLCVRDIAGGGGPAFAYRIGVTANVPQIELKSEVARVTLPRKNYHPIPLKLTRRNFTGPVDLEVRGAPEGVTIEPVSIPADQTEIVCRLRAADSAREGLSTIQIVGHWKSDDETARPSCEGVATTFPLIDCRVKDKDLRKLAFRQDQIDPPPSLCNRLALQVTPAAPFEINLPQENLLITKYINTQFAIETTRHDGFSSPIDFAAQGGQIGDEAEERSNIYLRFPTATPDTPKVAGLVFNRILTNPGKFRVDFTATATDDSRRVTLRRAFEMEVKSAFAPTAENANIEIEPSGVAKFRLLANRTPEFDGAVTVTLTPLRGFHHPATIEIPAGQPHVDIDVKADPETKPGRHSLRYISRGYVGKYEEEVRGPSINITIKKPPKKQ